jgi:hypothetical protein
MRKMMKPKACLTGKRMSVRREESGLGIERGGKGAWVGKCANPRTPGLARAMGLNFAGIAVRGYGAHRAAAVGADEYKGLPGAAEAPIVQHCCAPRGMQVRMRRRLGRLGALLPRRHVNVKNSAARRRSWQGVPGGAAESPAHSRCPFRAAAFRRPRFRQIRQWFSYRLSSLHHGCTVR